MVEKQQCNNDTAPSAPTKISNTKGTLYQSE